MQQFTEKRLLAEKSNMGDIIALLGNCCKHFYSLFWLLPSLLETAAMFVFSGTLFILFFTEKNSREKNHTATTATQSPQRKIKYPLCSPCLCAAVRTLLQIRCAFV
jgi:hypothetical protein